MNIDDAILCEAKKIALRCESWADLSNAIFGPYGLIMAYYPDIIDRDLFKSSKTYNKLHELVEQKMEEIGVVEGANSTQDS